MSKLMVSTKGSVLGIGIILVMALLALIMANQVIAHGGDPNAVHACVNTSSGEVKIVDPDDACKNNWTAVDWSKQGPAGPPGVSGLIRIQVNSDLDNTSPKSVEVPCPDGMNALGGGGNISGGGFNVALKESVPQWNPPTGWVVQAFEVHPTDLDWQILGFVTCATVAP